ncbi:MAG: hypothetical protein AAF438_04830, partial [Pseudomonadota bacterium]
MSLKRYEKSKLEIGNSLFLKQFALSSHLFLMTCAALCPVPWGWRILTIGLLCGGYVLSTRRLNVQVGCVLEWGGDWL